MSSKGVLDLHNYFPSMHMAMAAHSTSSSKSFGTCLQGRSVSEESVATSCCLEHLFKNCPRALSSGFDLDLSVAEHNCGFLWGMRRTQI